MKTFKEFVATNEHLSENVFDQIKNAATMFRYMTNPKSFPRPTPSGPANLSGVYKGSTPPAPKPARFQIGTPKPKPTARGGGSPISAVVQALTNLQGSTPQSGPAAERAKANREAQIQQRYGKAMNQTPSRFGKAGPDVPATASKPAEPKVEPKVQPRSVTTEKPKPKPSGPITTAQAGDNVGTPKSAVSTYRDKTDTKGLSVGRYKTLAQHRAAVAAQKNKK
jgi:hypothetical protein